MEYKKGIKDGIKLVMKLLINSEKTLKQEINQELLIEKIDLIIETCAVSVNEINKELKENNYGLE